MYTKYDLDLRILHTSKSTYAPQEHTIETTSFQRWFNVIDIDSTLKRRC